MKDGRIPKKLSVFRGNQQGAVALIIVLMLPVFLGFAALAVDVGYMMAVKAQLNNAAEAGALSGARALVPYTGTPPQPNWANGTLQARQTVERNYADKQSLSVSEASPGAAVPSLAAVPPLSQATPCYYRLSDNITRPTSITPQATDVPAMQVTVAKTAGHNGGPLPMMFANILGYATVNLGGQAVAMVSFPRGMPVGALFPLAAAETYVTQYLPRNPPVSFKIGSGAGSYGQWTSFKVNNNSASYVAGLISSGNPSSLNLNDNIDIQPGVKASNYGEAASHVGQTVVIPLVNPSDINSAGPTPVLGFVAFHIEAVSQGGKYIQGHYDKDFNITNAAGVGGSAPGTLSTPNPPRLVN